MATLNFTPTGGSVNSEGYLFNSSFQTWANAHNGTGGVTLSNATEIAATPIGYSGGNYQLIRYFFKIAYSGIPTGAIISNATLYFNARYSTQNATDRMVLALGTQSDTLATGDFNAISTEYGRNPSNPPGTTQAWYSFDLNATGRNAIANGQTIKYCFTGVPDFDNSAPGASGGPIFKTASDGTSPPYIQLTYTLPVGFFQFM